MKKYCRQKAESWAAMRIKEFEEIYKIPWDKTINYIPPVIDFYEIKEARKRA
jgi:hypothetical protein